jgi:hypothetical protein
MFCCATSYGGKYALPKISPDTTCTCPTRNASSKTGNTIEKTGHLLGAGFLLFTFYRDCHVVILFAVYRLNPFWGVVSSPACVALCMNNQQATLRECTRFVQIPCENVHLCIKLGRTMPAHEGFGFHPGLPKQNRKMNLWQISFKPDPI